MKFRIADRYGMCSTLLMTSRSYAPTQEVYLREFRVSLLNAQHKDSLIKYADNGTIAHPFSACFASQFAFLVTTEISGIMDCKYFEEVLGMTGSKPTYNSKNGTNVRLFHGDMHSILEKTGYDFKKHTFPDIDPIQIKPLGPGLTASSG